MTTLTRPWKVLFISGSLFLFSAWAASQEAGTVTMNGQIIDTACTIDVGSREQVVELGVLPVGVIRQQGKGPTRTVDIQLVNCNLVKDSDPTQVWQGLRVTFEGTADNGLFQVFGEARGVGLYLQDEAARQVLPGQISAEPTFIPLNMRLRYQLRLVTDNRPLRAGHYQSAIRFKLDYD
ncbi:fimbrial protein [Providencia alcalifaciens]|uniref:fimbrial protein n=1 Tax=Providencia alcalifaciens TaxID=126385 RepID=UPI003D96990A